MDPKFQIVKNSIKDTLRLYLTKKPEFLIVGAMKSGTTSLYYYISQHPEVIPSYKKEIHFFDSNYEKGLAWYLKQFPIRFQWTNKGLSGEASPSYMYHPFAAERIWKTLPNSKLIALLRNPVERAISHYFHAIGRTPRTENLPIMEALLAEDERLATRLEQLDSDPLKKPLMELRLTYKTRGNYYEQLIRFERFREKGNLLVLNSEGFFADPSSTLRRVFQFLEIDADFRCNDLTPKGITPNKTKVSPEVYEYLETYFKPRNQKLYEYLGYQYDW